MPTNAELTAQLGDATKQIAAADKRIATLTEDFANAKSSAEAERVTRQGVEKLNDALATEVAELKSSLRAYKGSATKARGEVIVLKGQLSPELRTIGAMKPAR